MRCLGLFAKYWQPGEVKTRLAQAIGPDRAAAVQRACLAALLARFRDTADERVLAYWPPERRAEFAALAGPAWRLWAQPEGDLGRRMTRFFAEVLQGGAEQVVLLGADSPDLPHQWVSDAFERLNSVSVVFGPSDDGGYYLLGGRDKIPPCLENIPWSSPTVADQTERQLQAQACPFARLPLWYDIDEAEDLARLRTELAFQTNLEPALAELRAALKRILESREL